MNATTATNASTATTASTASATAIELVDDPLWYKDAIIYELHVRAFCDSNSDGIGDFKGLTSKLDYLQDLGVTALWLLPFYPSPLRDDGYDISDYQNIHPNYGTLDDFREFLDQAHRRGLRVITELVINHTSDQHPWFQRARRSPPGSTERDYYIWSDTPDKFPEARVIFPDYEPSIWTWDPVARAYYLHRFYSHQPDLNYDNPAVHDEILPIVDFWLGMGVDGMRLDAIPHMYKREGTTCENLPETHAFLRKLRAYVDARWPGRMFLAEANMWPENAIDYFGQGDECHMAFHFPVMPRMFMALRMEDRFPIVDILDQTPPIPETCQWAVFLRNHDELTLEMVTDEERDYMVRAYADDPRARINMGIRRRLAPLLNNDRRSLELMHGLLMSLPGTPVLYYGDEIAMGDNIYLGDRNSVRTPMQWSPDRNAGFSRANPQSLYLPIIIDPEYHYEAVNVEARANNPYSFLWWLKRLIALRKRIKAMGRGSLTFLHPQNSRVLTFLREYQSEIILVVVNLSRYPQHVELDLSRYAGAVPVELFGQTAFPQIRHEPYFLSLSAYSFFWFSLHLPQRLELGDSGLSRVEVKLPTLHVRGTGRPDWSVNVTLRASDTDAPLHAINSAILWELTRGNGKERLEALLPSHLPQRRWFCNNSPPIKSVSIIDSLQLSGENLAMCLTIARIEFTEGDDQYCLLPLAIAPEPSARELLEASPQAIIAQLTGRSSGVLYDAQRDPLFARALFDLCLNNRRLNGANGSIVPLAVQPWPTPSAIPTLYQRIEQNWLQTILDNQLTLKLFRRLCEGPHPEFEFGKALLGTNAPVRKLVGALEYRPERDEPLTLAVIHETPTYESDGLQTASRALELFLERALTDPNEPPSYRIDMPAIFALGEEPGALLEPWLTSIRTLASRLAELHQKLATLPDPAFTPERFTLHYQRIIYQEMRNNAKRMFQQLERTLARLSDNTRESALAVLDRQQVLLERYKALIARKIDGQRIRVHGGCDLNAVLNTGKDFIIAHFEGDRVRTYGERHIKRLPLRDVAELIGALRQVAVAVLSDPGKIRNEDRERLVPWLRYWYACTTATLVRHYFAAMSASALLPADQEHRLILCDAFVLDRAVAELESLLRYSGESLNLRLRVFLELLGER